MLHDVTLTLRADMAHFPGEPAITLEPLKTMVKDGVNVTRLHLGAHTGTHVDAPIHFVADGAGAEQVSLEALVGECQVVELTGSGPIHAAELEPAVPAGTRRLLLKTSNSRLWDGPPEFHQGFRGLAGDGADWAVERGLGLVGIDYLSIEVFAAPGAPAHHRLLGAGVVIVEGLDLRHVAPGPYRLLCLPLKILGGDGAPARAVLETIG